MCAFMVRTCRCPGIQSHGTVQTQYKTSPSHKEPTSKIKETHMLSPKVCGAISCQGNRLFKIKVWVCKPLWCLPPNQSHPSHDKNADRFPVAPEGVDDTVVTCCATLFSQGAGLQTAAFKLIINRCQTSSGWEAAKPQGQVTDQRVECVISQKCGWDLRTANLVISHFRSNIEKLPIRTTLTLTLNSLRNTFISQYAKPDE